MEKLAVNQLVLDFRHDRLVLFAIIVGRKRVHPHRKGKTDQGQPLEPVADLALDLGITQVHKSV